MHQRPSYKRSWRTLPPNPSTKPNWRKRIRHRIRNIRKFCKLVGRFFRSPSICCRLSIISNKGDPSMITSTRPSKIIRSNWESIIRSLLMKAKYRAHSWSARMLSVTIRQSWSSMLPKKQTPKELSKYYSHWESTPYKSPPNCAKT